MKLYIHPALTTSRSAWPEIHAMIDGFAASLAEKEFTTIG